MSRVREFNLENISLSIPSLGIRINNKDNFLDKIKGSLSFADITEYGLNKILESHYNGNINLADIFSVGDVHQASDENSIFQVASHTASKTYTNNTIQSSPTCPKQTTIKWVIIGLNHDDLTSNINGISKAAITIQTLGVIWRSATENTIYGWNPLINDSSTNSGGWSATKLRVYTNSNFKNACGFKNFIKTVKKPTCNNPYDSTITQVEDSVFLLSYNEVYGNWKWQYQPFGTEGIQYAYFPTDGYNTTYTKKYVGWEGSNSSSAGHWWLRSCWLASSDSFLEVSTNGSPDGNGANSYGDFAPAACL